MRLRRSPATPRGFCCCGAPRGRTTDPDRTRRIRHTTCGLVAARPDRRCTQHRKTRGGHVIVYPQALEAAVAIPQLDEDGAHTEIRTQVHGVPRQFLQGLRIKHAGFIQRVKTQGPRCVPRARHLPQPSTLFTTGFEPGCRAPAVAVCHRAACLFFDQRPDVAAPGNSGPVLLYLLHHKRGKNLRRLRHSLRTGKTDKRQHKHG